MNVGTLSGLNVLTLGKVAPGATVELKNGSTGQVVSVRGRRLTLHGVISGSAEIRLDDGSIVSASNGDIATVLREAPPPATASTNGDASAVSGSGVPRAPRAAGV
jgi:hypothetical protein